MERIFNETINAIDYCPLRMLLEIQFQGEDTVYQYFDVPEEIWYQLKSAPCMDTFFNTQILGRFQMEKVCYTDRCLIRKSH